MRDPETLSPEEFAAAQQERYERDIRAEIAGKYDYPCTCGSLEHRGGKCVKCGQLDMLTALKLAVMPSSPHTRTPE